MFPLHFPPPPERPGSDPREQKDRGRSGLPTSEDHTCDNGGASEVEVPGTIARGDAQTMSVEDFFFGHLLSNEPIILTNVTAGWPSRQDWVTTAGKPDIESLKARFGDSKVPIHFGSGYGAAVHEWSLSEFAGHWERKYTQGGSKQEPAYLKDWHFVAQHGHEYHAYSTPIFFRDDWLNHYFDSLGKSCTAEADYRC